MLFLSPGRVCGTGIQSSKICIRNCCNGHPSLCICVRVSPSPFLKGVARWTCCMLNLSLWFGKPQNPTLLVVLVATGVRSRIGGMTLATNS